MPPLFPQLHGLVVGRLILFFNEVDAQFQIDEMFQLGVPFVYDVDLVVQPLQKSVLILIFKLGGTLQLGRVDEMRVVQVLDDGGVGVG